MQDGLTGWQVCCAWRALLQRWVASGACAAAEGVPLQVLGFSGYGAAPALDRGVATNKALEDLFIAPLAVPKPPQRFYYIFQEPVRTAPEDLQDPARIDALYRQVQLLDEKGASCLIVLLFCFFAG